MQLLQEEQKSDVGVAAVSPADMMNALRSIQEDYSNCDDENDSEDDELLDSVSDQHCHDEPMEEEPTTTATTKPFDPTDIPRTKNEIFVRHLSFLPPQLKCSQECYLLYAASA